MAGKIKAKDLSYDCSLPPFLQRLHAQNAGRGDLDRHERPIARPKKAKDSNADEDGPTVVNASGETVSKEEYDKLAKANLNGDAGDASVGAAVTEKVADGEKPTDSRALLCGEAVKRPEQKVTDGTAQKKRKAAKVVGQDETDGVQEDEGKKKVPKVVRKPKKKARLVKLAFEECEES